ncbi:MAG: tetratricopeptide repeat protein [Chitinophagales bacterium]
MKKQILFLLSILFLSITSIAYAQGTEDEAVQKAKDAENNKDYETALKWYKTAKDINPKNALRYYDLAWCYNELKKFSNAVDVAKKGLDLDDETYNDKLYGEYIFGAVSSDDDVVVEVLYKRLLKEGNYKQISKIGDKYFYNKNYEKAEKYYITCKENNFTNNDIYYHLGYINNEFEEYDKAIDNLKKAIILNTEDAGSYNELAYAYKKMDQVSNALDNYIKAYNLDNRSALYANNIGDIYFSDATYKDLDKALDYYLKALKNDSKDLVSNYRVGWIYSDKAEYYSAEKYLNKALEVSPGYADAVIELGYVYLEQNKLTDAEKNLKLGLEKIPDDELANYYLGLVYSKQNKKSKVEEQLNRLNKLNSSYYDTLKKEIDN